MPAAIDSDVEYTSPNLKTEQTGNLLRESGLYVPSKHIGNSKTKVGLVQENLYRNIQVINDKSVQVAKACTDYLNV